MVPTKAGVLGPDQSRAQDYHRPRGIFRCNFLFVPATVEQPSLQANVSGVLAEKNGQSARRRLKYFIIVQPAGPLATS